MRRRSWKWGGSAEGSKISDHQIFAFFLEVWLSEERTLSSAQSGPVGGEFVGIRHRSIFGSREPGVPREVVAMA